MKTSKIIAALAAFAMIATGSVLNVSAADTVAISAGKATAKAGETFSVDISLAGVPAGGISCVEFGVQFDKSIISISDVSLGTIANTGAAAAEGAIDSSLSDTIFDWNVVDNELDLVWVTGLTDANYWIKNNGVFVTVTGTVSASAADGASSALTIVPISRASYPESTTANSTIVVGYTDASGAAVNYGNAVTAGSVTVGGSSTTIYGDVDCNKVVNISDVVLLARYVSQDSTLAAGTVTEQGKVNANVNNDAAINADDISGISSYLGGLTTLPIA